MTETSGNLLLDALPPDRRAAILDRSKEAQLERATYAFDAGSRISTVYFPIDTVASLVTVMSDGSSVEAAMIGRDGMVGIPVALGRRSWETTRAVIQIPGRAHAVSADDFEAVLADDGKLGDVMQSLTLAVMTEIAQSVACNRLHPADQRLARWLARGHDGAQRDEFPLTHEFLAEMLGVRRATVTVAAQTLKNEQLIAYRRGRLTIIDGDGLRAHACECYRVISAEYRRLVTGG